MSVVEQQQPPQQAIPLQAWIEHAINIPTLSTTVTNNNNDNENVVPSSIQKSLAISSNSYLFAALKIASSLADQIINCQEQTTTADEDETRQLLPMPSLGKIVVIISGATDEGTIEYNTGGADDNNGDVLYFNVASAEILPYQKGENNSDEDYDDNEKMKYIYALGIVLYQLFSGGEKPPSDVMINLETLNSNNTSTNFDELNVDDIEKEIEIKEISMIENLFTGDSSTAGDAHDAASVSLYDELNLNDIENDIVDLFGEGEMNNNDITPVESSMPEKMPSKKKWAAQDASVSAFIESLKLKGVPASICIMIGNMINCLHNGDVGSGKLNDTYMTMSDVYCDLQLMIDQPNRFLYDLDMEKLAVTGLPFDSEYMFGRDNELSTLQSSYRRCISGGNECGVIIGPSGIGKSVLANRLGSYVMDCGGLFLSGKFDQLKQSTPFSALTSAFNEYCDKMTSEQDRSSHLQGVASKLRISLGRDARYLVKVIPKLSAILRGGDLLGDGDIGQHVIDQQDCADAQKRIQYLFTKFVDVVAGCSGTPIVLFLDDAQWADTASILAIKQMLMSSNNTGRQFYFIASCRDEGMIDKHPFKKMLSEVEEVDGFDSLVIKLSHFNEDMTNMMISNILCLPPRTTRSLSKIIYPKTKGSPLFLNQLIIQLCRDDLVRLSLSRRRWEWKEEKIRGAKLPDDIALFLASTIQRLPKEVQDALFTLSCFGAHSKSSIMVTLETKLDCPIIESLDKAVSEGLLNKVNDIYSFAHDWIQENSYNNTNMVALEDRCLLHFKYGISLAPHALTAQDDELLFVAASQINHGGLAAVEDVEQRIMVTNLNLSAGYRAKEMSDYESAHAFFDQGINFLPKGHWNEHYDLSLELFEAASKCALGIGDATSLKLLSQQIERYAKTFEDKLTTLYYNCTLLAHTSQLQECSNMSLSVLSQLGETIPELYSQSELNYHIEQTKALLDDFTNEQLLEYKAMNDKLKLMAMKFYARCLLTFVFIKPEAVPVVVLKMVQLSIARGLAPESPIGFTYFGALLGVIGHVQDGCRYVRIALKLLDKFGTKEFAGEVNAIGWQLLYFEEPIQAAVESHNDGIAISMAAGDTYGAAVNSILYHATMFYAGTNLEVSGKQMHQNINFLKKHGHQSILSCILGMKEWYTVLVGNTGSNENTDKPDFQAAKEHVKTNPYAAHTLNFQYMYIYFMVREHKSMIVFAENFLAYNHKVWTLMHVHSIHAFYIGLVSFWAFRETGNPIWADRGRKSKLAIQQWTESSQHNFCHQLYLLEAEEAYCDKNHQLARLLYEKAVLTAKKHRFINYEALACELAGYFFYKMHQNDLSVQYFLQAHEKYHEWGAIAKSNSLFQFVQSNLTGGGDAVLCSNDFHNVKNDPIIIADDEDKTPRKRLYNSNS